MKNDIQLPVMDIDGKTAVQVIVPQCAIDTVIAGAAAIDIKAKVFRINALADTSLYLTRGVDTFKFASMKTDSIEYFGALPGDKLSCTGGNIEVTWSF